MSLKCLLPLFATFLPWQALFAIEPADYVLRGGAVYTVDASRSWAEAVAISGREIVFVGLDSDVVQYVDDSTVVIQLNGAMVLPGFQDSHIHPVTSALNSYMCSLYGLPGRDAGISGPRDPQYGGATAEQQHDPAASKHQAKD